MSVPIVGYADRFSVQPGETIAFKVSSVLAGSYDAALVRVRCGDPNPAGPGIREAPVPAPFEGTYPARVQPVHLGSYVRIEGGVVTEPGGGFEVTATIWPTTPDKADQHVFSMPAGAGSAGLALVLDGPRGMSAVISSAGSARPEGGSTGARVQVGKRLEERQWYRIALRYDPAAGELTVEQRRLRPEARVDDSGSATAKVSAPALSGPFFLAARGTRVAGQDLDLDLDLDLDGDGDGDGHYNGKIERPRILTDGAVAVDWDFSRAMLTQSVEDAGPRGMHGVLVNLPMRAATGSNWTGVEHAWRHAPEQYGAIHFHDDDLYDCGWETDFSYRVPADLPSGPYAARLRAGEHEEMIPFYVRPATGRPTARICVLVPTFTYIVYGNYSRNVTDDAYRDRAKAWGARPWNPDEHRQFGWSTYNFHRDGSGIGYASRLRPMLNMRSGFLSYVDARGSGLRHYPADTHLFDWLEEKGLDFDVVTDEDLDDEGLALLAPYRTVLTTSHPEYHTPGTLDALQGYVDQGGRLAYLGGNGFYWRVARSAAAPGAIEIRRGEGGIRAWAAEPGEYYHAFDGQYGGLWRRNGRPPQRLAGVGFSAQGMFEGTFYRRAPGADHPRTAWIFDGVEDEILGDFGLSGGGAAGFELDRHDRKLGAPANAIVLASSGAHAEHFVVVPEELLTHISTWSGESPEALIRADMVYFDTPNEGAVFSVGSITFCGSLSFNDYDNNISRILENVLRRFTSA